MEADWGNYNAYDSNGDFVPYKERKGKTLRSGTNMGISTAFLSGKLKRAVRPEEVKALTRLKVIGIYRKHFWDDVQGDRIKGQPVADIVFNARVLHGQYGKKLLQKTLNSLGHDLTEDGKVGPLTLSAINSTDPAQLVNGLLAIRTGFVKRLAAKREDNDEYLKGWLNRLARFKNTVIESSSKVPPIVPIGIGLGLMLLIINDNE